jgi:diguanylate cyclase (GGDEF)-like protein
LRFRVFERLDVVISGYDLPMVMTLHSGQPLRQYVLRRVAVLVVATAALLFACFVGFGFLPMADQVAKNQFDHIAERVQEELDSVLLPSVRLLEMSSNWLSDQVPDLESPLAFNHYFKPLLRSSSEITSVVAGTSSGQGWMLLQQGNGAWRNRMTDVPRWGTKHHLVFDEAPDGVVRQGWSDQTYDPRLRPWFTGALTATELGYVHWTSPYTFATTGDPGVTVSMRSRLADGRDFVVGLDLMLRDLSIATQKIAVSKHGMTLVLTSDERLLALPVRPAAVPLQEWLKRVMQPVSALGMAPVDGVLARWHGLNKSPVDVLSFESGSERWLASVRPYVLGNEKFWVLVLAPAADFSGSLQSVFLVMGAALFFVLGLALWMTKAGTSRLSKPLEVLAENSRRIGQLDWSAMPEVLSQVTEIQQLASSQKSMRETLFENQLELDARAEELRHQVLALQVTESTLQQKKDMLQTILDNFPGGVSVANGELQIVAFNTLFKTLLDLPDELLNRPVLMYEDLIRHNALRGAYGPGDVESLVAERVELATTFAPHRFERTLPNGTAIEVRGTPLPQGGMVTLYIDITASKQHERALEQLAHYDALTGLPNRVLLADRLRQGMTQEVRRGTRLAVAYLDLDGFKQVNDRLGHHVGDQLLVALTVRMREALREGDTLARLGGDEFVAILTDVPGLEDCTPMLNRLLLAVSMPITVAGNDLEVSASIGVSMFPQDAEVDAEQLLRQADQAMYQAKQSGKNRYRLFDAEHDRTLRERMDALKRIERALVFEEFVLYFQPKVNLHTGQVVGVEALIRWQHPQQGLLAPGQFLPLIEDHPLSVTVGEWVFTTALAQMAKWKAAGVHLEVSVNVGARQLQHDNFVAFLRSALASQPTVAPDDFQIEVLETSALQDMTRVSEVMTQCRHLGVHFALDDFGTGYSSLTYLKRLPVSQLKIDQSFVRDMLEDPDDLSILLGVLDLSTSFRRTAIAEGVETVEHGRMLLQLGCQLAQGYGIARPMPGADVPDWIAAWKPDVSWSGIHVIPRADLPVLFAQVEHRAWMQSLHSYLFGISSTTPPIGVHLCQIGKWIDTGGLKPYDNTGQVDAITGLHVQLHALARQLCDVKTDGDPKAAMARWTEMLHLGESLLIHLQEVCQACEV